MIKLLLTVGAMTFAYAYLAQNVKTALAATLSNPGMDNVGLSENIVFGTIMVLIMLLSTTLLSIFKPGGRTALGRRALVNRRKVKSSYLT